MHRNTLARRAVLSTCSLSLLIPTTSVGQQLGAPQAYPQQQPNPSQQYSQSPYPQTGATASQPQVPVAGPPQTATVPQPPAGFQLNPLEAAELDQVLTAWQVESGKISSFKCTFQRWEYDVAFSPKINNELAPLNKNRGELNYSKPDKGSFQITEINTFKQLAGPAGQQPGATVQGDWIKQPEAIGDHWVSDGKSIYEYRPHDKQLVERPIPPEMQGKSIVDGPLPFLFGAEPEKLKQRYWMRIERFQGQNPNQVWLVARPKYQEQAADFRQVEVIFSRQRMLPEAMQVTLPNGDRHAYMFDIATAKVNGPLNWLNGMFSSPRVPWGWTRVVEKMPVAQNPDQPAQPERR